MRGKYGATLWPLFLAREGQVSSDHRTGASWDNRPIRIRPVHGRGTALLAILSGDRKACPGAPASPIRHPRTATASRRQGHTLRLRRLRRVRRGAEGWDG
ncbi:hypothetical protein GCM10010412_088530 [Nonomuraea recticatena]|uniref:Uncharacterized protein n=1 Tax=Nonomuraea recticatena TaxID=46178 RepID=A0ABP6FLL9_9ACTN